jgi:hypothetical protein
MMMMMMMMMMKRLCRQINMRHRLHVHDIPPSGANNTMQQHDSKKLTQI